MVISRLSFLKPDWCLFIHPVCSRWDLSLCWMTLSKSFTIELIRLMGLQLVVREGRLSGFSNIQTVAIFHAVGVSSLCMVSGLGALPLLRNLTNSKSSSFMYLQNISNSWRITVWSQLIHKTVSSTTIFFLLTTKNCKIFPKKTNNFLTVHRPASGYHQRNCVFVFGL